MASLNQQAITQVATNRRRALRAYGQRLRTAETAMKRLQDYVVKRTYGRTFPGAKDLAEIGQRLEEFENAYGVANQAMSELQAVFNTVDF